MAGHAYWLTCSCSVHNTDSGKNGFVSLSAAACLASPAACVFSAFLTHLPLAAVLQPLLSSWGFGLLRSCHREPPVPLLHRQLPTISQVGVKCCLLWVVVLGKFGPGPIGTQSGPDQTLQSWSRSGIFLKTPDHLVSGLGIPILPKTISDLVWTRTT